MTRRANRATKGNHLSDEDVAALMLMIDPDLTHLEISTQFSDSPIVVLTKEGASFTGVVTAVLDNTVELRQSDGKCIHVLKRCVAAVRRP